MCSNSIWKGSISSSAFPMNICSICDKDHMVSSMLVQQLSTEKSLLTMLSLIE